MKRALHLYRHWLFLLLFFGIFGDVFGQNEPIYRKIETLEADTVFYPYVSHGYKTSIVVFPKQGKARKVVKGGNNYEIQYILKPGYEGLDTVLVEYETGSGPYYFGLVYDIRHIRAKDDVYLFPRNASSDSLSVLSNDVFGGTLHIGSLPVVTNGTAVISPDHQGILYTPSQPGLAYLTYTACDSANRCAAAQVAVYVQQDTPQIIDTIRLNTLKNNSVSHLLGFAGATVIQPQQNGTVEIDGITVTYTPAEDYFGIDTFTLQAALDGQLYDRTYIVNVLNQGNNNRSAIDDQYYTSPDSAITFDVFKNDVLRNILLKSYTSPEHGTIQKHPGSNFTYTPDPGFTGDDYFTYRAGAPYFEDETATVRISVSRNLPEYTIINVQTIKNNPVFIPNNIPINNYNFIVNSPARHGSALVFKGYNVVNYNGNEIVGYNLIGYYPNSNYIGPDSFKVNYCVDTICVNLLIRVNVIDIPGRACYSDCVWPGDADNNGRVSMSDLLPLSYYMGEYGPTRDSVDLNNWYGQVGTNWQKKQTGSGQDYKYLDANGDGFVSKEDTVGIDRFYLREHKILTKINQFNNTPVDLHTREPYYHTGDLMIIDVTLGRENAPAIDFNGLTYSLNFSEGVTDINTVSVNFDSRSFLTEGADNISLVKKPTATRVDAGVGRISKFAKTGYGDVSTIVCIVDTDADGFKGSDEGIFTISMSDITTIDGNGQMIGLPDTEVKVKVKRNTNSNPVQEKLLALPNPASGAAIIHLNGGSEMSEVRIFDMMGRIVHLYDGTPTNHYNLDVSAWADGMYIVSAVTNTGLKTVKLMVTHGR